jgi:FkbM family methyltransferase
MYAYSESEGDGYTKARALGSYWLHVWDEDQSVSPHIMNAGYWESWITAWFTDFVRPGMTVLDIGAHCGYYTGLSQRLVGPYGRVIAYEPNPVYVEALNRAKVSNDMPFKVRGVAVGANYGKADLHVPRALTGGAVLNRDMSQWGEEIIHRVPVVPLNEDYGYLFDNADIIKIDTEGGEYDAWKGGTELWNNNRHQTIVMEWTPGCYPDTFYDELCEWGHVTVIGYDGRELEITKDYLDALVDWQMVVVRKL